MRQHTGRFIQRLDAAGRRVNPLWLGGLFPCLDQLRKPTFHLADGRLLIYDDCWIGFRYPEEAAPYAPVLEQARRSHPPEKTASLSEFLALLERNPMAARSYYESKARDFQAQADSMQAKAEECRRLAQGNARA